MFEVTSRWTTISAECKDFLRAILKLEPTKRLTAAQALNHPWLATAVPPSVPKPEVMDALKGLASLSLARRLAFRVIARSAEQPQGIEVAQYTCEQDPKHMGAVTLAALKKLAPSMSEEELQSAPSL